MPKKLTECEKGYRRWISPFGKDAGNEKQNSEKRKRLGGAVANWVTFADGQIYISNSGLKSVTAINMQTKKINAVVPVGEVPKRINTLVMK